MLRVVLTPEAEMLRRQREWDGNLARAARDDTRPTMVNATTSASLLDRREYVFRGRSYRVPPVPWPLAVKVLDTHERLIKIRGSEQPEALERLFREATQLAKVLVRPVGFFRRILWPLTRNPFRNSTPSEVGHFLGFSRLCLMTDSGLSLPEIAQLLRGTSPQPSPPSSTDTRPGSTSEGNGKATRSPGRTSLSGRAARRTTRAG